MAAATGAAESLPPFALRGPDATAVRSGQLPREGAWLLVYVRPHCLPCKGLLHRLKGDQGVDRSGQVLVVVGDTAPEGLGSMARAFPDLGGAAWYADPTGEAARALKIPGVPVVLGMRDSTIAWRLSGLPVSPADLRSILTTWLSR